MLEKSTEPKKPQKKPQTFDSIYGFYSLIDPGNQTVLKLGFNFLSPVPAQEKVIMALAHMKQTQFINLVHTAGHAKIAMAMYAGDGVVTKITPNVYLANEKYPFVLPPFAKKFVEGNDLSGNFTIENYPCIETGPGIIDKNDVEKMRKQLAKYGMKFTNGDDKPDNIGRLPDGTLAILDGNAVQIDRDIDPEKNKVQEEMIKIQLAEWEKKIHETYPIVYANGYEYIQSAATDYTIQPMKAAPAAKVEPPQTNKKSPPLPFFKRLLSGSHRNNDNKQNAL